MAELQFIAAYEEPTYDFRYITSASDYVKLAEFFGDLSVNDLIRSGISEQNVAKIMKKVIIPMYNGLSNPENTNKRFVMPVSAMVYIIKIVEALENVNPVVIEFKQTLASLNPE